MKKGQVVDVDGTKISPITSAETVYLGDGETSVEDELENRGSVVTVDESDISIPAGWVAAKRVPVPRGTYIVTYWATFANFAPGWVAIALTDYISGQNGRLLTGGEPHGFVTSWIVEDTDSIGLMAYNAGEDASVTLQMKAVRIK